MTVRLPKELSALLHHKDPTTFEAVWERFVQANSKLILHAAHSVASDHDGVMDRYAYVLDQLRHNDCRRLRAFATEGQTKFSTWLIVISQRLCIDYHRRRYGRDRDHNNENLAWNTTRIARRQLADLFGENISFDAIQDTNTPNPEQTVRRSELRQAVEATLDSLDTRDRLLIQLRFEKDLPIKEITRMMGFPSQFHVYRKLKATLKSLRKQLEDRGVSSPAP